MLDIITTFWIFWVFGAIFAAGGAILAFPLLKRFPSFAASLFTALIILGGFTACGVDDGTVVEKVHFPDLSYWTVGYSNGQVVQVWVYNPECYRVKLEDETGKTGDHCVKFRTYQSLNLGDHWSKP